MRSRLARVALGLWLAFACAPARAAADPVSMTIEQLLAQASELPPTGHYVLAGRLFEAGRRDEAVMWFYVAQIRARLRQAAEPGLPPDGEPALYASFNQSLGQPINGWAFGDIDGVARHMMEALDWDAAHDNPITPKASHAAALAKVRDGLEALRTDVLARKDEIRRTRLSNGLGNR